MHQRVLAQMLPLIALAGATFAGQDDPAARGPVKLRPFSITDLGIVVPTGVDTDSLRADLSTTDLKFVPDDADASATSATPAEPDGHADLAQQLANPVANLISVPFQFNYDEGFGDKDAGRYTLNIQPVIPITISDDWNLIVRTILPIIHQESLADGLDSDTGLGDTTQSFFFSPKEPIGGWILGVGPVALWPTGTDPQLRNESFGFGPTLVALRQEHGFTFGVLANHLWSVTNSDDHEQVNATFLQPFLSYTWPTATTLALNAEATYDWNQSVWTVPLNLQLAQLVTLGKQKVQFQVGGRYYVESPDGGPEWGLRFTMTFLFPK